MDRLMDFAHRLARYGAWAAGALIIAAALMIGVDIGLRKLFSETLGGASELSGYVLAISATWGFSLTMLDRAHIRIDSLYVTLPVRLRAVLDMLSLVVMLAFVGFLTWQCNHVFLQTWQLGSRALTPIATPLAIPQALWMLGLVYFLLVLVLLMLRASIAFITGDIDTVQRIAGSRSAVQELPDVLDELAERSATRENRQ